MADGMMQRTEDRGQRTGVLSRRSCALNKRAAQRYAIICLLSSVLSPLNAEELPDPTRPPASIAAPAAASGVAAAPAPAGLQSIIISKTRRAAIIDGETVELGGKHGDAKLIEVREGSVVLRSAQGRQVLTLFPDVKITGKAKQPAGDVQSGKRSGKPVVREEKK